MHDCARFERRGLPSAAMVSSAFLPQARHQAAQLGLDAVAHILVPVQHPMSDQTLKQMRGKADAAYPLARDALVEQPSADADGEEKEEAVVEAPHADCSS